MNPSQRKRTAGLLFLAGGLVFMGVAAAMPQPAFYGVGAAFIGVGVAFLGQSKKQA